jgi:hypothetical protein
LDIDCLCWKISQTSFPQNFTQVRQYLNGDDAILNVMDVMSLEYGELQVTFGSKDLETGLARPSTGVSHLATIEFNDTKIEGGSQLHFYLYAEPDE